MTPMTIAQDPASDNSTLPRALEKLDRWLDALERDPRAAAPAEARQLVAALRTALAAPSSPAPAEPDYRSIVESADTIIARHDRQYRHVFINAAIERVTGRKPEAFLGQTNRELGMPADLCALWERAVDDAFAQKRPVPIDFDFPSPTLGLRHFQAHFAPEVLPDGTVATVVSLAFDVTDAKRREDDVARLARQLEARVRQAEEAERTLHAIMDHAPVGIALFDAPDVTLRWSSRYAVDLHGRRESDLAGASGSMLPEQWGIYQSDGRTHVPADRLPIVRAVRAGEHVRNEELLVRRPDGTAVPVLVNAGPIHDAAGAVTAAVIVWRDIAELKQAEQALRRSEAHFRNAVELNPQVPWIADADGAILDFSHRWLDLTGLTREQALGAGWMDVPHPDDRPRMVEQWTVSLRTGRPYDIEHRIRLADGTYRWMRSRAAPCRDDDGRIVRWYGSTEDIHERKLAEEKLRASEELVRTIAENSTQGMAMMDERGYCTYANRAWLEMTGFTAEEIGSAPLHDLVHHHYPDGRPFPMHECPIDRALPENFDVRAHEDLFFRKDGSSFPVTVAASPIFKDGKPIATVLEVRDVTEARRAEQALRQSEQRYRFLADAIPQIVWTATPDGTQDFANARWYQFSGFDPGPPILDAWREACHPDDFEPTARLWARSVATAEPYVCQHRLRRHDGEYRWLLSRAIPQRDEAGQVVRWFGTATDITELKDAEAALRRSEEALRQANGAKDHFLAVLSHELRTPLTPVLAAAQLLEADPTVPAAHHDTLHMIRRNVELEARLIDDLLDLTRITRNKLDLHLAQVDVHAKVRNVVQMCADEIAAKQLQIDLKLAPTPRPVRGDPARVQQVVWNLLKNAVKFTPPLGRITLATEQAGDGFLVLRVSDTGVGMTPDMLPRVFEAFEQGGRDITRQFGGLGLGLAITKALVEMHGGTIDVASEGRHRGSSFTVRLPTEEPDATPRTLTPACPRPDGLDCAVLLVEDHDDTRAIMTRLLGRLGCRVHAAPNAADALAIFDREPVQLIISDLGLPDRSGIELLREVRQRSQVPAIALSGYGMDEDLARTRAAGFNAHLVKPVVLDTLKDTIRRLLQ